MAIFKSCLNCGDGSCRRCRRRAAGRKFAAKKRLDPVFRAADIERTTQWRKDHPEEDKVAHERWRARNPEYFVGLTKRLRAESLDVRLASNLRARVGAALRRHGKSAGTAELVGCSISELRAHLEAKFRPGMSWANYGAWHIDHTQPLAAFDLSDPAQQRVACHYTNLQPLWAEDNLRKSAKEFYEARR